ncbi:MAG TPA: FAD-binding oxidoreductase, partial [Actinomycetota bacterium]|nr:FAD-binding oxidoreductase [Actinomycetota bacterium]
MARPVLAPAMEPDVPRPGLARSYWLREALALDPGAPCPPLDHDIDADVVVLGGGYTGMWTAYFLTEYEPATRVVILESDICGGGPSGRNGGFVLGMWDELPALVELFGERAAMGVCRATASSVAGIGRWCREHDVDAWFNAAGQIQAATTAAQEGAWRRATELAERLGVGDRYRELTPDEVRTRCRSPVFRSGAFMRDAATVQPARLARGLRRVLLERGVRIFEGSPVRRFRPGPPAIAATDGGTVSARRLVLGLNAWSAALPAFRRSLVVWGSYIALTAPAPEALAEIGWTGGECLTDLRTSVRYLRTTPDGRIAAGGGGGNAGAGHRIGPMFTNDPAAARSAVLGLRRMFPPFSRVSIEAAWGGPIDVSPNHLPFFGTLPPGNVHYAVGYTGNGVGPSYLAGRTLAALALDREDATTRLALVDAEPRRFPPEPLRSIGARVVRAAILRKEGTEE